MRKNRIAFLLTHPIPYLSGFFTYLAEASKTQIEFVVYYQSNCSVVGYKDNVMGTTIKWDIDLLNGYNYKFIPCIGQSRQLSYIKPYNYGLKQLLSEYRPDALIILGYNRPFHWFAMLIAKQLGVDVYIRDDMNLVCKKRSYINIAMKRIFFRLIDRYIKSYLPVGKLNDEYYRYHGVAKDKLHVIPWAVNNDFFANPDINIVKLRQELGVNIDVPILIYVGNLLRSKGILDLLDAFDLLSKKIQPCPYLIMVGDGELKREVQSRSQKNLHIIPVGFKNQSEIPSYLALCDLLILPSFSETWGLVVNEAMAAGKPVIVSNKVGCWPDLIEEGETGRVFSAGDVQSLLTSLMDCLKQPDQLAVMGIAARSKIDSFSYQVNMKEIIDLLAENEISK